MSTINLMSTKARDQPDEPPCIFHVYLPLPIVVHNFPVDVRIRVQVQICLLDVLIDLDQGFPLEVALLVTYRRDLYREVQLDLTTEIEVFHMLLERCHT